MMKIKAEKKVMLNMHIAEMRARDRRERGFFFIFAACILYAVCAMFVRGFV